MPNRLSDYESIKGASQMKKWKKRIWLSFLGAALLAFAGSVSYAAARPPAAQTTKKKKAAPSKSRRRRVARARGQKAPTADRIKEIQTALQREGSYEGSPNGKWDAATIDAMKKYQDKNGLNPTGKIDALTLQKLGLGSETAGKGAPVAGAMPSPNPAANTSQ
jgi:peptidoglycan hydrolase-like protein with peptidoglycan-binding domain